MLLQGLLLRSASQSPCKSMQGLSQPRQQTYNKHNDSSGVIHRYAKGAAYGLGTQNDEDRPCSQ